VSAAFASERDAAYAASLIAQSPELVVRYVRRTILSERGDVQMVILEATLADPANAERVETCMAGAHGVRITSDGEVAQSTGYYAWAG
jgi:hypothetical protein